MNFGVPCASEALAISFTESPNSIVSFSEVNLTEKSFFTSSVLTVTLIVCSCSSSPDFATTLNT